MVNPPGGFPASDKDQKQAAVREAAVIPARKSKSMHEGVAVWCDCCSCEAEPYWVAIADEMGIDLGSDYEEQ